MSIHTSQQRAVVIGGSMAGLLAARILSDHYGQVTIVESDAFAPGSAHRRGVPQSRHTHGLLSSGRQVLERLFPGLTKELLLAGAVSGDIAGDARWFMEGGCLSRSSSGLNGVLMTRPFLEGAVRSRVLSRRNVSTHEGCRVLGLEMVQGGHKVTGVRIADDVLRADLVVDATGRGSKSPQWLVAIGYDKPDEERIEVGLGYTTRLFRRRPHDLNGDIAVVIPPTPHGKRGGVMLAQEGNQWTVTLMAHFGNQAPADLPGFIEFSRTIPAPYIYEVIRDAEPLGEATTARFPASVRHRYERLKRFPEGYLVFGDAISSFNPIYGQGMSVAALQSMELDAALTEGSQELARRFFARAADVVDIPWSIAAGNDLRIPEVVGPRTTFGRLINWYMGKLHQAGHTDPIAALAFLRVANLLEPPPSVMAPHIAWRVLCAHMPKQIRRGIPMPVPIGLPWRPEQESSASHPQ